MTVWEIIEKCKEEDSRVCDECPYSAECLMFWTGDDSLLKNS